MSFYLPVKKCSLFKGNVMKPTGPLSCADALFPNQQVPE